MSACGQYIGVWLGAPDQEEDLIALNAEDLFTPASNTKLFTVAAAQARLLGSARSAGVCGFMNSLCISHKSIHPNCQAARLPPSAPLLPGSAGFC